MTEPRRPTVIVATLTYRRPEMLRQLLDSLRALEHPDGWDVRFLIVDNDPEGSARSTVEAVADRHDGALDYVVEHEPGIPFARNRALRQAIEYGAMFLSFIDDDEIPDPAWLRELLAHREATGAVLIGGPVLLLPPTRRMGRWRRFLARSLIARNAFLESRCGRQARQGRIVKIGTGNWMADLAWIRDHDLRFATAMRFTGGTDSAFLYAVLAKGGTVSWCDRAVAHEALEPERVSLRYQFARSRAQAIVLAGLQPEPPLRMCLRQSFRMLVGLGLMFIPVLGFASFTLGVHMIAVALGRFSSLRGAQSALYARLPTAN